MYNSAPTRGFMICDIRHHSTLADPHQINFASASDNKNQSVRRSFQVGRAWPASLLPILQRSVKSACPWLDPSPCLVGTEILRMHLILHHGHYGQQWRTGAADACQSRMHFGNTRDAPGPAGNNRGRYICRPNPVGGNAWKDRNTIIRMLRIILYELSR